MQSLLKGVSDSEQEPFQAQKTYRAVHDVTAIKVDSHMNVARGGAKGGKMSDKDGDGGSVIDGGGEDGGGEGEGEAGGGGGAE